MPLDVAIVDYQMSNLHSVQAACNAVGIRSEITSDPHKILEANSAILPGVGAFGESMMNLKRLKLDDCIYQFIDSRKPFVGICLGMQLLFRESEEFGTNSGLGIINGSVKRFIFDSKSTIKFPIPQIGWNQINQAGISWNKTLLKDNDDKDYMYFVHSFHVVLDDAGKSIASTTYGSTTYCSALIHENVFAIQFHPEKSGPKGIKIYSNLKSQIDQELKNG